MKKLPLRVHHGLVYDQRARIHAGIYIYIYTGVIYFSLPLRALELW